MEPMCRNYCFPQIIFIAGNQKETIPCTAVLDSTVFLKQSFGIHQTEIVYTPGKID